ncbi:MAG: hypothetical protein Q7T05_02590 [Dehalococcoidia bacterium]|nr:hypothetical protein [Dehalococcoidia bacterium]
MPPGKRKTALRKSAPGSTGFYSRAFEETDRDDLFDAAQAEGLDDEVAVLRLLLRRLLKEQPDEVKLQLDTVNMIAKTLRVRYQLSTEQKNSMKEAIFKVLTEVAIPLGIKFLPGPK